uniref:BZIP domain-containing protein n=1 Tax=Ganoderma boninense TaxID=34458 RepID=A0A5K1JVC8_9APHY|nr:BZIP domain-containing protein [Ganoderma boninense]
MTANCTATDKEAGQAELLTACKALLHLPANELLHRNGNDNLHKLRSPAHFWQRVHDHHFVCVLAIERLGDGDGDGHGVSHGNAHGDDDRDRDCSALLWFRIVNREHLRQREHGYLASG